MCYHIATVKFLFSSKRIRGLLFMEMWGKYQSSEMYIETLLINMKGILHLDQALLFYFYQAKILLVGSHYLASSIYHQLLQVGMVLWMSKCPGSWKPLSLCLPQWKCFLHLGYASDFTKTSFPLIYAPSCSFPSSNKAKYLLVHKYKKSLLLFIIKQVFLSNRCICGEWMGLFSPQRSKVDFCRRGLVSTLVILKGCNPVILQLCGKQQLWNITDDHAGG